MVALNVTEDEEKLTMLLCKARQETQELFNTLPNTEDDPTNLDGFFTHTQKLDGVCQFRQAAQKEGEMVDQFVNLENCQLTESPQTWMKSCRQQLLNTASQSTVEDLGYKVTILH